MNKDTQTETQQSNETNQDSAKEISPVVIDMGNCSKKKIKKLKKGKGPLLDNVKMVLEELATEGKIDANVQPVFIVVKQKKRTLISLFQ